MTHLRKGGFTLVETMIATGLLSVLSLLMFTAVQASIDSSRVANAETRVQSNIRETLPDMIREIELAARATTAAGVNGLAGITVFRDGVEMDWGISGDLVVFQTPLDNGGVNWSQPIQYRFVNEDVNSNSYLDDGEDAIDADDPTNDGNGDGLLTRCIVREQDIDANGDFEGVGERRIIGAANELDDVVFTMNLTGDILTVTLRSRQVMGRNAEFIQEGGGVERMEGQAMVAEASTQIYILN
jgi:prepilin-type N-terminal cleavage/methylation domain-containing protein